MSDHWNSIANLLGTPSLNPMNKKSDAGSKSQKTAPPVEPSLDPVELTPEIDLELPKAKPEPSRLRSSWDAVAQFFGVSVPEPATEQPAAENLARKASESAAKQAVPSKKSKPSMWGVTSDATPDEPSVDQSADRDSEPELDLSGFGRVASEDRPTTREPREQPARRGARDRRPRVEEPRTVESRPAEPIEIDAERDSDSELAQSDLRGRRNAPSSRVSRDEPVDADRRSNRRPPRRGRTSESESVAPISGPELDADLNVERVERPRSESNRGSRSDSDRGQRGRGNRDSSRASDRSGPSERSSSEHSSPDRNTDRNERSSKVPERGDRAERTHRSDRARPQREERAPHEDRSHREPATRSSSRDSNVRDDRRPPANKAPKPTGFGAGLHDDDDFDFHDEPSVELDPFVLVDDQDLDGADTVASIEVEPLESRPKRRRGRGRGRRGERATSEVSEKSNASLDRDSDDDDAEAIQRHTKIPSWQEAIGALVATNMENHQRNPNQSRAPRGRGPRRDR